MKNLLKNYKSYEPQKVCFLDSKYVDKVLSEYKGYSNKFILCSIKGEYIDLDFNGVTINFERTYPTMVRMRIKLYDPQLQKYEYHVNLLIFDTVKHTIERFEPLQTYEFGEDIDYALRDQFRKKLPEFRYGQNLFHPQKEFDDECKNMGLCVAHVIKFAICYLYCGGREDDTNNYEDIYRFCAAIIDMY
jgi:hypothetical protein